MTSSPRVSVVVPTKNGARTVLALVEGIRRQRTAFDVEIVIVDSGSTDGTLDLIRRHVDRVMIVEPDTFNHGLTRNAGIEASGGEFVVLTVQDAEPDGDDWLSALVAPLIGDDRIAGTYARQCARPDATAIARHYLGRALASGSTPRMSTLAGAAELAALAPMDRLARCTFDNVCSCIRRSVWRAHPFRETTIGEDLEWARDVLLAGYSLAYVPAAAVRHSHDRGSNYEFARTRALHARLYDLFGLQTIPTRSLLVRAILATAILHMRIERGRPSRWADALGLAVAWPLGQYLGRARRDSSPRRHGARTLVRIVIVVHGFPPRACGGSEIYAESQARALRRIYGDDVLVIAREADESRDDYAERTESRDGLTIAWINNTFRDVRSFAESYRNETIAAIADRHVAHFRPDIASIHHLTCLSTGIVPALARRRVPSVYTLHDYWLMCHRGQLLDRNGAVCDELVPSGCRNCIGAPATAGAGAFAGAKALRAVERVLPDRAAAALRRTAGRVAERLFAPDDGAEARARDEHMRAVTRDVTHFLAPSDFMRRRCEAFGVSGERISPAGYGVDAAPFNAVSRVPSDRLRIGFLGSLMISKAPHVLLEAFSRLSPGTASLDLYGSITPYHGDDSYRSRLEPLLHQPGVRAHGAVPHERVPEILSSIDVLVVPSIWPENSPFVIREAFLAGVPVVASRVGGIPELVTDGVTGLLVEPGDLDALHRALLRLVTDPLRLDTLLQQLPAVKTIEDDVAETRALFERLVAART